MPLITMQNSVTSQVALASQESFDNTWSSRGWTIVAAGTASPSTSLLAWAPLTTFVAGQHILAPDGTIVNAVATHTTGQAYDPTKYSLADPPATAPAWAAFTPYLAGAIVRNPSGELVAALAAHTSGATHTPANWTPTASGTYASVALSSLTSWLNRRRLTFERDNALPFDYYVDSVGGLDTNDGLTPLTPWQTLTKVNTSATLTAGKRVGLKRGSVFRYVATGGFTVPGTGGSAAQPVVIGSYGVGALPVLKGSTVLTTFTSSGGGVYTKATAGNPNVMYVDDDTLLIKAASAAAVMAGTFFSDGTTLTFRLADSSDPAGHSIEYPTNSGSSLINVGVSYVVLQDIAWKHSLSGSAAFLYAATMAGMQVKRCDIGPNASNGFLMGSRGGLVEDCYDHDNWTGIEYPTAGSGGFGMTFTSNTDGTEVRYNIVLRAFKGIQAQNAHANLYVHHNLVVWSRVNGIDMTGGTAAKPPRIWNNFVWHRTANGTGHGIDTQAASVGPYWRNNVVYCDDAFGGANCEMYCIDSTAYSSVDTDYNLGYLTPAAAALGVGYGKLGTTVYPSLATFQAALAGTSYAGKEAHSIQADPLLDTMTWPKGVFVPGPGSPCLNAGVPVKGGVDALGGLFDFFGSAPDLGAFERVTAS